MPFFPMVLRPLPDTRSLTQRFVFQPETLLVQVRQEAAALRLLACETRCPPSVACSIVRGKAENLVHRPGGVL
jgi:hypothetical protein